MEEAFNYGGREKIRRKVSPQVAKLPFEAREAINVLRGNIQLSGSDMKLISVTSAVKHEGKSSTAFLLTRSFASLEKKALYIDCDIRKSATLRRYKIDQKTIGLTEYLCGNYMVEDIIYETDSPWMDMVFTGAAAPNPSDLLTSSLFDKLLAYAKENYDYVIVDTPPINVVIDGALVCKRCDGTVVVIECGVTERAQALHMKRQLDYAGVKVIGAVLNKVGVGSNGYYGYGYRYGYGYNTEESEKRKKK